MHVAMAGEAIPNKRLLPPYYPIWQFQLPDPADRFCFVQPALMDTQVYNFSSQSRVISISLLYCILLSPFDFFAICQLAGEASWRSRSLMVMRAASLTFPPSPPWCNATRGFTRTYSPA